LQKIKVLASAIPKIGRVPKFLKCHMSYVIHSYLPRIPEIYTMSRRKWCHCIITL